MTREFEGNQAKLVEMYEFVAGSLCVTKKETEERCGALLLKIKPCQNSLVAGLPVAKNRLKNTNAEIVRNTKQLGCLAYYNYSTGHMSGQYGKHLCALFLLFPPLMTYLDDWTWLQN